MSTLELPLSVSQGIAVVNGYLEGMGSIAIQGEVSGFHIVKDQLVFFEIKDSKSRLSCFLLRGDLTTVLEDGMEIVVEGTPRLFQTNGRFHMRIHTITLVGAGALRRAYELLKKQLEREGLFLHERKRLLPRFPEHIGVITSRESAAWSDVSKVLRQRWPLARVTLAHVGVQGAGALSGVVGALRYFNTHIDQPDVIIVTRGGGSLEDLQAFNTEPICREIAASRIPVVCAIGHERDVTLAELVADERGSTPSNAAELATPSAHHVQSRVNGFVQRVCTNTEHHIERRHATMSESVSRLSFIIHMHGGKIRRVQQRWKSVSTVYLHIMYRYLAGIRSSGDGLFHVCNQTIAQWKERIQHVRNRCMAVNPQSTLKRGYTITYQEGHAVASARCVQKQTPLSIRFFDGTVESSVLDS